MEETLSIIKPDAVAKGHVGQILDRFLKSGLSILSLKMEWLTRSQAEEFYAIHRERPFFSDLVHFISSGPIVISVLSGKDAIAKNRQLMGETDPKKAAPGTIRADFAESIDANAVHGSDSSETAAQEISYFFGRKELYLPSSL